MKGSLDTVAGPLGALLNMTTHPNQFEPVEGQVKIYVCVLFVNSLMEVWPAARNTRVSDVRTWSTARYSLQDTFVGDITHYSTNN